VDSTKTAGQRLSDDLTGDADPYAITVMIVEAWPYRRSARFSSCFALSRTAGQQTPPSHRPAPRVSDSTRGQATEGRIVTTNAVPEFEVEPGFTPKHRP
jgi:hypothetical protein